MKIDGSSILLKEFVLLLAKRFHWHAGINKKQKPQELRRRRTSCSATTTC
ncbi:unnamed protein product [Amoebophrya sp. A120]|nr:unnamed protein product [Amoebophrya sp. A120]|eukprot:GSA120T00021065001.1